MTHYLALIDGADGIYGAAFPDCPGCTAMGATHEELIANATAALREWMADRVAGGLKPPVPRASLDIRYDPEYAPLFDGRQPAPLLAVIPLLLDAGRVVRANISMDAGLLDQIDTAARARGLTRSGFLASAAREKIEAHR